MKFVRGNGRVFMTHSYDKMMMSNTQFEYRTNVDFVKTAQGRVLISGLGMGMILLPLAKRKEVSSITVLEKSQDLIDAVAPYYKKQTLKLEVICADALTWKPEAGRKFDWAWHDIWPDFGPKWLPQYAAIKHKRWVLVEQGCWAEKLSKKLSKRMARIERSWR